MQTGGGGVQTYIEATLLRSSFLTMTVMPSVNADRGHTHTNTHTTREHKCKLLELRAWGALNP
jgi:hypothetical protein